MRTLMVQLNIFLSKWQAFHKAKEGKLSKFNINESKQKIKYNAVETGERVNIVT